MTRKKGICFWCRRQFFQKELTDDHLVPVGVGGGNAASNIVRACKPCNEDRGRIVGNYVISRSLSVKCDTVRSYKKLTRWLKKLPGHFDHQAKWVALEKKRLGHSPSEKMCLAVPLYPKPRLKAQVALAREQAERRLALQLLLERQRWEDDGGYHAPRT